MLIVDPHSPTPPYEQVRAQLAAAIRDGSLPVGAKLPPIRRLAEDLGLAANTVARAYRELEQAGWVVTRGRHGTQVQAPPTQRDPTGGALEEAAARYARTVRNLGASPEQAVSALQRHLVSDVTV